MSKLIHKLEDKLGGHGGSSSGSSSGAQNGGSGAQKYAEQGGKYAQQHLQGSGGGGQGGSGLESAQNKAGEMYAKHQAQSALGGGGGSSGLGGMTGGSGSGAGAGALGGAAGVAGVGGGAAAMSGRGKEDSKLGGYADEAKDAYGSSTGASSRTDDLRHPVGSAGSKGYGGSATDGTKSGSGLPVDRDGYGFSDVPRSRGGGVTNESKGFSSGPQSSLENRDSIPTAGGRVPGSGGGDHHYGRDAAMVGGAGAAGAGAYEYGKHRGEPETASLGRDAYGSSTTSRQPGMSSTSAGGYGSSSEPGARNVSGSGYGPAGTTGSSYTNDPARDAAAHHDRYGGPVAGGTMGGMTDGVGRSGTTKSSDSAHPRMSSETGSSGGPIGHGVAPEKKLGTAVGNAYEAGYRDAMAHMAAERGE
ncbi:hypothetical protein KC360_g6093 [Hortaea werneckii]|nr:hypothetical protein KC325_g6583 [Hortaea werneckii]KAI6990692.1 hypothetical protein KC359_g6557 [Hortaea werneckii]KAI7143764.1 hypothetical protein KC344_g6031 [Hortaea werneckii]KAI7171544.1 hypothetical protein KC360_g6093 [Hortaea werneckii]